MSQKAMAKLWLRMAEIYGHRWTSSYGDKPNETWAKALGRFSFEQIRMGLNKMLEKNIEWPPTLTEFIAHCKPEVRDPAHVTYQLPKLRNNSKEVADQNINKLKEIMGEA